MFCFFIEPRCCTFAVLLLVHLPDGELLEDLGVSKRLLDEGVLLIREMAQKGSLLGLGVGRSWPRVLVPVVPVREDIVAALVEALDEDGDRVSQLFPTVGHQTFQQRIKY